MSFHGRDPLADLSGRLVFELPDTGSDAVEPESNGVIQRLLLVSPHADVAGAEVLVEPDLAAGAGRLCERTRCVEYGRRANCR